MSVEHSGMRQFELTIDGKLFAWPAPRITGADIKSLAGVDVAYGLWQEHSGTEDSAIRDRDEIDLQAIAGAKFFTMLTASVAG